MLADFSLIVFSRTIHCGGVGVGCWAIGHTPV